MLEEFLEKQAAVLGREYVVIPIDTERHAGGRELAARLRDDEGGGGVPWMAILDADGRRLATSTGPRGNVGYPFEPHEIAHFMTMVRSTARNLTPDEIAGIERALQENAEAIRGGRGR